MGIERYDEAVRTATPSAATMRVFGAWREIAADSIFTSDI
jgi:hypothetical protein